MKTLERVTVTVKELMTERPVFVDTDENVMYVAHLMDQKGISSVLVKRKGDLVGIITDRDIITRVVSKGLDPVKVKVGEVASTPLMTINEDAPIEEAAKKMAEHHVRRLVVERDHREVGIVAESDMIRVDSELHFLIRERSKLEGRMTPTEPRRIILAGFCEECGNYSAQLRKVDGLWLDEDCRD
jgi:signal-transduction protein with cAMP-binding, CBS, and nucleotidyltransferase domain